MTWQRSHNDNNSNQKEYWDDCESPSYLRLSQNVQVLDQIHFKLPDGQEIRIVSSATSMFATSKLQTELFYMNITDSWIDSSLWSRVRDTSLDPWGDWVYQNSDWRVYGSSPDPWDAPDHLRQSPWPPQDTQLRQWTLKTCNHVTGEPDGSVDYDNATSDEDVYRTSADIPLETASFAVQGTWQGLFWEGSPSRSEIAHDMINPEILKMRIEQLQDGFGESFWRFWVGYGDGQPRGVSGVIVDLVTYWDRWASAEYTMEFDLFEDGTITLIYNGTGVSWPVTGEEDPTVYYDSELGFQRPGVIVLPSTPYGVLSPTGLIEFQTIIANATQEFLDEGWLEDNIGLNYVMSLVRKPIEE